MAAPDRQRGAPVAAARERPVDVVGQPVAVAAVLDGLGEPVGLLVLGEQRVLDLGGPDVPRRLGVVDQRGVAAPAVRVAVLVGQVPEQQPARVEVGDQVGVGVLEELPADQRDVVGEVAVGAHGHHDRQAVGAADGHVVLAEGGGLVHQTGAVLGGDVVGQHHEVGGGAAVLHGRELHEVEGALVGPALHLGPGDRGLARSSPRPARRRPAARRPRAAPGRRSADDVGHVGVHRDRGVGDQRPRRRRPDQQGRAGRVARPSAAYGPEVRGKRT